VEAYAAEPDCWWPDGLGGTIRPDAFLMLQASDIQDLWWIEVDLATESLPTIRTKLQTYLDFVNRGQLGPMGTVPRVLFAAPTAARCNAIAAVAAALPSPAEYMFRVTTLIEAPSFLVRQVLES
jgi:hypothetical protein